MGLIVQNYGPDYPIVRTYLIPDSLRCGDLAIEQLVHVITFNNHEQNEEARMVEQTENE